MYTSVEAVLSVLSKSLDDEDATAASLTTGQIEDSIISAGHEIDAKLSRQYVVPFADEPDSPPLIAEITRDIAAYLADLTFRQDVDYTSENDPMLLRYRRAQEMLQALITGDMVLTGGTTIDPGPTHNTSRPQVTNSYEGDLFGLCDFDLGTGPRRGRWEYWPGSEWD